MALCQCTPISWWHCANARLYIIVALCQSIPLYPSGTVPNYASMAIFLLHCANTCLYMYFLVALCQYLPLWLFSCCTVPIPAYTCMHLDSFKSIGRGGRGGGL